MRDMSISRRSGAVRMSSSGIANAVHARRDGQRPVEAILVSLVVPRVVDTDGEPQRRVEIGDDREHQPLVAAPVGIRLVDARCPG